MIELSALLGTRSSRTENTTVQKIEIDEKTIRVKLTHPRPKGLGFLLQFVKDVLFSIYYYLMRNWMTSFKKIYL